MRLTLLIDLDDTLLRNPMEQFLPKYIAALSAHLAPYIDPKRMVPQLLQATDQMVAKDGPCENLETVFSEAFYPPLGLKKSDLALPIADFYDHEYDQLQTITQPVPAATKLIDYAHQVKWSVVIATNPLFPLTAVLKRLKWAGLPADPSFYSLITSYETMHFAKPNPAFYAEILGKLGWSDGPVCMVGNSYSDDLAPAAKLGIPTFWIEGNDRSMLSTLPQFSSMGSLEEVIPWLEQIAQLPPLPEITDLEGILAVLKSTPAALEGLLKVTSRDSLRLHPIPSEWSLLEVLCHMRDVEREVNLPRFELLSTTPNPFIPGIDSDIWAVERNYNEQDESTVFSDFCSSRSRFLQIVNQYGAEDWHRSARHSFFGRTTRLELAQFIAAHDRTHLQQFAQTIQAMH